MKAQTNTSTTSLHCSSSSSLHLSQKAKKSSKSAVMKLACEFEFLQIIGSGGFAFVYVGNDVSNEMNEVAIKVMNVSENKGMNLFVNETKMMKKIGVHKNICSLKRSFVLRSDDRPCNLSSHNQISKLETDDLGVIVMERMEYDLLSYIFEQNGSLEESICKIIFKNICEGVSHLHSKQIAHLDLKPENILLKFKYLIDRDSNLRPSIQSVQICDFGFATSFKHGFCSSKHPTVKLLKREARSFGTREYRAPEVHNCVPKFSPEKADIWSLGVILFTMITGYFPGVYTEDGSLNILNLKVVKQYTKSKSCYKLIKKLLHSNMHKRPTIQEVVNHPWFT